MNFLPFQSREKLIALMLYIERAYSYDQCGLHAATQNIAAFIVFEASFTSWYIFTMGDVLQPFNLNLLSNLQDLLLKV